jgi:hypothetical protein
MIHPEPDAITETDASAATSHQIIKHSWTSAEPQGAVQVDPLRLHGNVPQVLLGAIGNALSSDARHVPTAKQFAAAVSAALDEL